MSAELAAPAPAAVMRAANRWLLLACAAWLLIATAWRPLMLPDEGRYVGVAWEMLSTGNWRVPMLDGLPFFHKPPLFYWISTASMQIFGAHAWAARLASALPAIAALVALHAFVRRHRDERTANLTAVILATQPFFFGAAQFANLDMLVASMITLTIVFIADAAIRIEQNIERNIGHSDGIGRSLTAGYVFAALGVLAKGLIGWLLPAAVIILWLALRGKLRVLWHVLKLPQLALTLLIAAPWFLAMQAKYPQFLDYFFVEQHFRRFAGAGFNNAQPFWFYLPVLLALTLPWSLWWLSGLRRRRQLRHQDGDAGGVRLLMQVWPVVIIGFFSIPQSKLIGYILPALPPLAYLLANRVMRSQDQHPRRSTALRVGLSAAAAIALCAGMTVFLGARDPSQLSTLALPDAQRYRPGDQLVMLNQYAYDLPFYLHATSPAWIVDHWQSPAMAERDNWSKEIRDAGRFYPEAMQQQLLLPSALLPTMCEKPGTTYWIWARKDSAERLSWLSGATQVFSNRKNALWRLPAGAATFSAACAERPSNG